MGMDMVELVLRIEEDFGVELPDEEAERIETPGQLHAWLMRKLRIEPAPSCLSSRLFYQSRRALMAVSGQERRAIRPGTRLEELLPRSARRASWAALEQDLGIRLPRLMLPESVSMPILRVGLALCSASTISLVVRQVMPALALLAAGVAVWWLGFKAARPLEVCFPPSCQTVGDVVRLAVAARLKPPEGEPIHASGQDIWQALRAIIADELSVPMEKVTPQAHFTRDLGAG